MLHGSTERLHHLAKIYEERIAPLLIPVFSRYRIGTRGKRANPVSGVYLVLKMVFTRISELLKVFIAGIIQLESRLSSMYGEAILPPEKSTSVTLITVPIRFH